MSEERPRASKLGSDDNEHVPSADAPKVRADRGYGSGVMPSVVPAQQSDEQPPADQIEGEDDAEV